MTKRKKTTIRALSLLMTLCLCATFLFKGDVPVKASTTKSNSLISKVDGNIYNDLSSYFDDANVSRLPETVSADQDISVIVEMSTKNAVDAYTESGSKKAIDEYLSDGDASTVISGGERERISLIRMLDASGIKYTLGESYNNVVSGFEITVKAADFEKVERLLNSRNAKAIVGDVYESMESQVITNNPYIDEDTGIFKNPLAEKKNIDGRGVVVAVLDTGLDYTHSAFSDKNYPEFGETVFKTMNDVGNKLGSKNFSASQTTKGLTAADVWVNRKVPYAYDYADKDADVLPINSEHGTHVAGIIAGDNDVITGVAPNAQLAIMKVFSDMTSGAKTSWLIAALEDCINLGVDVINMSLGSSCGFSTQDDKKNIEDIYSRVKQAGISLIAAASNDYNATMGSTKNGNNGLTSNPDSGTVGSPSTYDAALSVASVDGVKTSYLLYQNEIIYFTEASTSDAEKKKDFVSEFLAGVGKSEGGEFEYVTIPGVGQASDYPEESLAGKIALVKRGTNTFEEKVRVALEDKGAAGIIIYNNVSGDISMSVGDDIGAVCSVSQEIGEMLAKAGRGKISIYPGQKAGPFMSAFSSWGPTSDLRIKPEITAHGGEIYSAVPGGGYDRLSGTSMAAPNQAGATALVRQYVKYSGNFGSYNDDGTGDINDIGVTAIVNQLMMSTTDILLNKNGLAYAVRKQGAGLMSILKSTKTNAYIVTYQNGAEMDKSKLEIGDDKEKLGVYKMTFGIRNFGSSTLSYNVGSIALTEGVNNIFTGHGDTTVTMNGYQFDASLTVDSVKNGKANGNVVTISGKQTAEVTVTLRLSDDDKKYLNDSFKHGMYVEGFLTLDNQAADSVDLNVPFLGFYGDWTEAPIFDEEYYDTNKDELNGAIDDNDKLMADAYATRVTGGLYSDYIATMGAYYFKQNPKDTKIPANKEHIAISNQVAKDNNSNYTISSIRSVTAGLLRNAKTIYITATEDVTGKEIFRKEIKNQRKSYSGGGSTVYGSSIDIEFSALEHELKNNTKYWFRVEAYIDYGENENQKNARNVFEFPVYVDFEAPAVTGVEFRTESDKTTKKTSLYADLSVYDNHYTMGLQVGEIVEGKPLSGYMFAMESFGNYMTPVYSSFNSTSKVTIELTDYIEQIKQAKGIYTSGGNTYRVNSNSFIVNCYDYAMNAATYEVRIPDEVMSVYFNESEIKLSPNQTQNIDELIDVYPAKTWKEVLDYKTVLYGYDNDGNFTDLGENNKYVDVVKGKIIAKESTPQTPDGKTERPYVEITATGKDAGGAEKTATIKVYVYSEGEDGYKKYGTPTVGKFNVTGYKTDYAFYTLDSEDREIGFTGSTSEFESGKTLSMYPSEQVTLNYEIEKYFDDLTSVTFESGDEKVVEIDPATGKITAIAKGKTTVSAIVMIRDSADSDEWRETYYLDSVVVTVKDPFKTQAIYLSAYKGAGETLDITYENADGTVLTETQDNVVVVPGNKGVTTINNYAFSGYRYVDKDTSKGDVIDEEDPYYIKQQYIGDRAIKKVILPHGVTTINEYAFAYLTALEEVVFPSTLKKIGLGAFQGCNNLKKVTFAEIDNGVYKECDNNLQFINKDAFAMEKAGTKFNFDDDDDDDNVITLGESQLKEFDFSGVVAIGRNAFSYCTKLEYVTLPDSCQSISEGAFSYCTKLRGFTYSCDKLKLGAGTFEGCNNLVELTINADVIPANVCVGLTLLKKVVIGKDVKVINQQAFYGCSNLTQFEVDANNGYFTQNGNQILTKDETELVLVAPAASGVINLPDSVTKIGVGAFSSNTKANTVKGKNVTSIGSYAFYGSGVRNYELGILETIGNYAFALTSIRVMPNVANNVSIGERAFAATNLEKVELGDGIAIGDYAFFNCTKLASVTLGNNVTLGEGAFASSKGNSVLTSVTLGNGVIIGAYAFFANVGLKTVTLGNETIVGAYAFQHAAALAGIDLSKAVEIGDYAFAGIKDQNGNTAPVFTKADLSNVTKLGIGAFCNNEKLANVTLSDKLEAQIRSEFDPDDKNKVVAYTKNALAAFAFAGCTALKQITVPETLEIIDDYAFYGSGLENLNLNNVVSVGEYAFANTNLTQVNGEKLASIGNAAFMNCGKLEEFDLSRVETIGDKAFMGSALKEANLSSATTIGSFAFADTAITKVTFGENLAYLGDNPFYGCDIAAFGKYEAVENFAGIEVFNENITISANVFVEDGVLYRVTENGGYELVSYPMLKADRSYTVKAGTTRISARAFYNTQIVNVFMPYELKAIGDKAFYAASKLSCVTFTSLAAPNLEEEYDEAYAVSGNHPYAGKLGDENGLGIVDFYMWNLGSRLNNYYYGANFANYVGKVGTGLTMVYPANGSNYDSFVYAQYFATKVSGESAPTAATLAVIELINQLPKGITLEHEKQINEARAAYNNLGLASQQALVTNYSKLTDAESAIDYLKNQDSSSSSDSSSDNGNKTDITWVWIVIPCVCIICAAVVLYFTVFSKRKGNKSETEEDFDETMLEIDDDDETSDDDNNN